MGFPMDREEIMSKRNKSVTELVHEEGIQDAKLWRDHWRARAAEEDMRDEGDMLTRPLMNKRVFLWAAVFAFAVYGLLTAALVLIG
jgi:hypothetical protein